MLKQGAEAYDRQRGLARLLPVDPTEFRSSTLENTNRLCKLLARALRQERMRGRSGHWTYDLNRHLGLVQAYKAERRNLAALRGGQVSADHAASPTGPADMELQTTKNPAG